MSFCINTSGRHKKQQYLDADVRIAIERWKLKGSNSLQTITNPMHSLAMF